MQVTDRNKNVDNIGLECPRYQEWYKIIKFIGNARGTLKNGYRRYLKKPKSEAPRNPFPFDCGVRCAFA